MTQKEFFNSMAERWDTICHHDSNKISYVLDLLDINKESKILDVGTGTGIMIPFLIRLVGDQGEITAIDFSEKMIEMAQSKYKYDNVHFVCDDVFEAVLPNEYFDYAICYSVFPHFSDKKLAIKVISDYIKDSGKLVIFHSQSREDINNHHKDTSEIVAEDNLPPIDVIKGYLDSNNMKTIVEIDTDDMFAIVATKCI